MEKDSESEPGSPRPDQDVGQHSNRCKAHGALHPVVVELLGFLIGFGCLFVLVVLAKLVGVHWRDLLPGAEDAKSMSQGVKAAVYTFMSHII